MSVYIPGMEMPKRGHTVTLTILGGGEVCVQYYDCKPHLTIPIVYKAIPVPDHGDLIDRNTAIAACIASPKLYGYSDEGRKITDIYDALVATPAIVPAEGEDYE